jgi:hypothetical protein
MPAFDTSPDLSQAIRIKYSTIPRPKLHECAGEEDIISSEVIDSPLDAIKIDKQCYSKSSLRKWIEHCKREGLNPTVPHNKQKFTPEQLENIYSPWIITGGKLKKSRKNRKNRKRTRKINKKIKNKYKILKYKR